MKINLKRDRLTCILLVAIDVYKRQRYEEKIKSYGGIDLFMGGIGPDAVSYTHLDVYKRQL